MIMKKELFVIVVAVYLIWSGAALGATILVPADQSTIQAAIDIAGIGDLILVSPGTYVENIDFLQKSIILQSEAGASITIIDGNQTGPVVTFIEDGTDFAVIDGFTIQNGHGTKDDGGGLKAGGGGIVCGYFADPTIQNCRIINNQASNGGGIRCEQDCSPTIENCTISGNYATGIGGAIACYYDCYPMIINCIITDNTAQGGGGISAVAYTVPQVIHTTITGNIAFLNGGGIMCYYSADSVITNSILWGNSAPSDPEIFVDLSSPVVTYSDIQGGWPGEGNIDEDPLFAGEGNYHILVGSPCIDSGTDAGVYVDMDGDVRPYLYGFDMGADEYTEACWDQDEDGYTDELCGGDDCDDGDPAINPGAEEDCDNGIDDDCDGDVDGDDSDCSCPDHDADGFSPVGGPCGPIDCDDDDPTTYPGADELCDGKDNDCDEIVPADEADEDGDGWRICSGDCDETDPAVNPGAAEICDNCLDDDCDGLGDGWDTDCCDDDDGDGFTDEACGGGDCDDTDPAVRPKAPETPGDGIDSNCNGNDNCFIAASWI